MITKLKLLNFQSHKKTVLNFDPGLNIIVGTSNHGKSSIMRALDWTIRNNRPSGEVDCFQSWWADDTKVILYLKDKDKKFRIIRRKSGTSNTYKYRSDNSSIEYKAFGQKTPDEVNDVLNIKDINIQNQHDKHFLLFDRPGDVTKKFNNLLNLSVIDSSLFWINRELRACNGNISHIRQDVKELKAKAQGMDWLKSVNNKISKAEKLEISLRVQKEEYQQLLQIIKNTLDTYEKIKEVNRLVEKEQEVDVLVERYNIHKEKTRLRYNIGNILIKIKGYKDTIKSLHVDDTLYLKACELRDSLVEKNTKFNSILTAYKDIIKVKGVLTDTVKNIDNLSSQFKDNFPDECPLCGKEK